MPLITLKNIPPFLLLGYFALFLSACQADGEDAFFDDEVLYCAEINMGAGSVLWEENVPYGIDSIWIERDCLFFDLAFGGGCSEHHFDLFWDGTFSEYLVYPETTNTVGIEVEPIDKIPKVTLYLIHESRDACDAMLTESHSYSLLDIRRNDAPEVHITVHSATGGYNYQYRWN